MEEIRLLLVDDEEDFRTTLANRLKKRKMDVTGAGSGSEAIELVRQRSFDVAIVDVKMPGIGGLELQEHLNAVETKIPIIFISAYQEKEISAKAMKAGAKAFLSKPFDDETLLGEVYSALGIESQ